jgi:putative transcriptional regulator
MKLYRYLGSGLPNVYLKNGYEIVETPYGEGVTIHSIDGLHAAIGAAIVNSPSPLVGYEFRFLRNELELSQKTLGKLLGCDEQAVARWEKGKSKQVNSPAERILRLLYEESNRSLHGLIKSLQRLECAPPTPRMFIASEANDSWSAKEKAA